MIIGHKYLGCVFGEFPPFDFHDPIPPPPPQVERQRQAGSEKKSALIFISLQTSVDPGTYRMLISDDELNHIVIFDFAWL